MAEAISIRPIRTTTKNSISVVSQARNFEKLNCICAKRFNLYGKLGSGRYVSCVFRRERRKITMGLNCVRAKCRDQRDGALVEEGSILKILADGLEATLNNLSKWLLIVLSGAIVLWRHDACVLWASMGGGINVALSIALKKLLKHQRPSSTIRSDPGMPSSHAQSIFYTITFLNLSLLELHGRNGQTTPLTGMFFILGSYFSWLRFSQGLHTVSQVVVGAIIGSVFSILWSWSWNAFVADLFLSYLWVKLLVVSCTIGFSVGVCYAVLRTWIVDER